MVHWKSIVSVIAVSTLLVACGGGGGGSSGGSGAEGGQEGVGGEDGTDGQGGTDGQDGADGEGDEQGGDDGEGGTDGQGDSDSEGGADGQGGTDGGTDGSGGTDGEGEPDGEMGEIDDDIPLTDGVLSNNIPTSVGTASTARVVLSEDGPTIGLAGAAVESIDQYDANTAGAMLIRGTYRLAGDRTNRTAVWGGAYDRLAPLFVSQDPVPGKADNVRFGAASLVDVSSDGSFGIRATLSGAEDDEVLLRRDAEATDWSLVVEEGDRLPGFPTAITLEELGTSSFSAAGVAFAGGQRFRTDDSLWVNDGTTTNIVAANSRAGVASPPLFGETACEIFFEDHRTSGSRAVPDSRYGMTDTGAVVFEAQVGPRSNSGGCLGRSILRYTDGSYAPIVRDGDVVPGAPVSTFSDVYLIQVLANGDAVIGAELLTPIGESRPDSKSSFWLFPATGNPRLIVLEGEEVQAGGNSFVVQGDALLGSREYRMQVGEDGVVVIELTTNGERTGDLAVLAGPIRNGQPHATIPTPGASNLVLVQKTNGSSPQGYVSTSFYTGINSSAAFGPGVLFRGTLQNAATDQTIASAVWAADLEGGISTVLEAGDLVSIGGISQAVSFGNRSNSGLVITREIRGETNALIVGGDLISGSSNNNLLLAITPRQ